MWDSRSSSLRDARGCHFKSRVVADPDERARIYARQKEIASNFADYEKSAAPREIPVILLDPVA